MDSLDLYIHWTYNRAMFGSRVRRLLWREAEPSPKPENAESEARGWDFVWTPKSKSWWSTPLDWNGEA